MMEEFEMTDLGLMKYILGFQVKQSCGEIFISQEKYAEDLLKKFQMTTCKPVLTPMAVRAIQRFMSKPSKIHYAAAKRFLRYLQRTKTFGLRYVKKSSNKLVGFADSDWASSIVDRRSTSGYLFCLGSKLISWSSRKQNIVALSSAEAEYAAATSAACEAVWLRGNLTDLQRKEEEPTVIFCDNMSVAMTKSPVFHARSKHIELHHHLFATW
ncbi:secreted RxLR effector protein 161-like [Punica granatum]|uniref:Secreted RxLR effector protein 161-like n=1 Tax=Punica granatum TaxID=22663 RepID=A0A6P8EFT8_PUNGR|nr:secreted RxLR effector protein 161-like [Punica granatum]